ncbi:hypothetical protein GKZ89_16690 [Bacillus mangrovi]|uniref:Polysaccharide chain length determinant N-terminal domain-containing protein n=1 Tax=Metabacillus mangrovi TaxID=1491830 RepID=A0A7X2S861_9BACI|nr:hypothetical protein [Metabacillus mangrovi]MTH55043.1 hypothetical protein [Metabacillus mangrovi]
MKLIMDLFKRLKKNIVLVILVPFLLAGVGYFYGAKSESPEFYSATTKMKLGKYEDQEMNLAENVKEYMLTEDFIFQAFNESDDEKIAEITQKIKIENESETSVRITYSGEDEKDVENAVEKMSNLFLSYDSLKYKDYQKILNETITESEKAEASSESFGEAQRLIFEMREKERTSKKADAGKINVMPELSSETFSPKKRALLGFLVGAALVFFYIVIPVLFRMNDKR